MKLQLIARHIRDDVDHVIREVKDERNASILIDTIEEKLEEDRPDGFNWRYSIVPADENYR